MGHQRNFNRGRANHQKHNNWDEVHNQLLTIQKKSLGVSDPNVETIQLMENKGHIREDMIDQDALLSYIR